METTCLRAAKATEMNYTLDIGRGHQQTEARGKDLLSSLEIHSGQQMNSDITERGNGGMEFTGPHTRFQILMALKH